MRFLRFLFSRFFIYNLLIIGIFFTLLLFFVSSFLNLFILHKETTFVPSYDGLNVKDLKSLENYNDFNFVVLDSVYVDSVELGKIIKSFPESGKEVTIGRKIYLTINSTKKPMIPVPNVKNASFSRAKTSLENSGFKVDSFSYVNDIALDAVIGVMYKTMEIEVNQKLRAGTHLWLKVGNGYSKAKTDSLSQEKSLQINE